MDISKIFEFDYGHRVWTQKLNPEYSLDNKCVCRHLHGHRGVVEIVLEGDVQQNGMVTDFKHLNWFKKWLDDSLDHKFIIDANDPLFSSLVPNVNAFGLIDQTYFKNVNTEAVKDDNLLEWLESFCIVDFVPTSENVCKWLFSVVSPKMQKIGIKVKAIKFKETPKSLCVYEPRN
jgi:6-pyruvoyltetrahydropterin/6-carboxytetrahydropterin synthase